MRRLCAYTTKKQTILGLVYLVLTYTLLPLALTGVLAWLDMTDTFTVMLANIGLYVLNIAVCLVLLPRFLWGNLRHAMEHPLDMVRAVITGMALYFVVSFAVGIILLRYFPDFTNANDEALVEMGAAGGGFMTLAVVVLAPIGEEILFRGVLFQSIQKKNRFLAYIVTGLLFASIHIVGYIPEYGLTGVLVSLMQYLPATMILAYAYETSGTLLSSIFVHMLINTLGWAAMR